MSTDLPSRREPTGPAAIAIAESVTCCSKRSAAFASGRTNVTIGVWPAMTAPSSSPPIFSAFASGGPMPPLVGSLTVIATSPLARVWRTYSTPPSSLTLNQRTLNSPLSVTLFEDSETTHAERSGAAVSHSPPRIWQIA